MTDVTVGDQTYSVQKFTTFKVIEATSIVTSIMEEVPQLGEKIGAFSREYRETNSIKIPRSAAELRYTEEELSKITETAWEASNQHLEVPASPGGLDIAAHVFPDVFRVAREQLLRLVALVATPNSELRAADDEERVPELLNTKAKALRHEDAAELLDLLVAASEVLTEQFKGKAEALGPVAAMFGLTFGATPETSEQEQRAMKVSTPEISSDESSTPSPVATDGAAESASTVSASRTPEPSLN